MWPFRAFAGLCGRIPLFRGLRRSIGLKTRFEGLHREQNRRDQPRVQLYVTLVM
jgi:hypothetical protein